MSRSFLFLLLIIFSALLRPQRVEIGGRAQQHTNSFVGRPAIQEGFAGGTGRFKVVLVYRFRRRRGLAHDLTVNLAQPFADR